MNPEHTIPNGIDGELTPTKMGKEQDPNLNMRENNTNHRIVDEDHSHDSTMEKNNVTQFDNGGKDTDSLREHEDEHHRRLTTS